MLNHFSEIRGIAKGDDILYEFIHEMIVKTSQLFRKVELDKSDLFSYKSFNTELWLIIDSIHSCTSKINQKDLAKLQLFYRGGLFSFYSYSLVFCRALTKPYGYPGDYTMLQTLYDNKPPSQTRLGKFLDQFFFDDELAKAVVNRVETMGNRLIEFINSSEKEEINILNIASGSGFELKKIISKTYNKKIIYHCFDQELASLLYIQENCSSRNKNVEIRLYREDIKAFFRNWKSKNKFDFIYNIGLADYLPDRILTSLIQESLNNLNTNGVFVIAHKDYSRFPYQHPSWFYDWNFIHRSLDDYCSLLKSKIKDDFSIWFESKKQIIFFSEFMNR